MIVVFRDDKYRLLKVQDGDPGAYLTGTYLIEKSKTNAMGESMWCDAKRLDVDRPELHHVQVTWLASVIFRMDAHVRRTFFDPPLSGRGAVLIDPFVERWEKYEH